MSKAPREAALKHLLQQKDRFLSYQECDGWVIRAP